MFRKRETLGRCWFRVLDQLWLDVSFLMGTFLFCFMFVLDLALFCVLVLSASVDVGAALVQNWVDVLCSK